MNQTAAAGAAGTEVLSQEVVDEAAARVSAVLHGGGQANGQVQAEQVTNVPNSAGAPIVATSAVPVPRTRAKRKPNGTSTTTTARPTTSAVDTNQRTVAITLPKETLAWFEQQASEAPFEPSVQKYLAWELRQLAKARQQAAQEQAREQTARSTVLVNQADMELQARE